MNNKDGFTQYLGDGVYVRYDGYLIGLLANDLENPTDRVFLEPEVFHNLCRFAQQFPELRDTKKRQCVQRLDMSWDREKALYERRALTRDGRLVFDLREAVLDGEKVLVGFVTDEHRPLRPCHALKIEMHVWKLGGFGHYGDHDLVDYAPAKSDG